VRKEGRQLTGLTAADFELRDNGVKQEIETVEAAAVPIDLSIVVDLSGNPDRPQQKKVPMSKVVADVEAEARKLVALLRPGDRVRLLAQDTYVQQIWPLQSASSAPRVERVDYDGQSSLYDTVATLLLQPSQTTRRHVIVLATKGIDTVSAIESQDVQRIADHADAQLHLVMLEKKADEEASIRPAQCSVMDLCRPAYRFWTPPKDRLFNPQRWPRPGRWRRSSPWPAAAATWEADLRVAGRRVGRAGAASRPSAVPDNPLPVLCHPLAVLDHPQRRSHPSAASRHPRARRRPHQRSGPLRKWQPPMVTSD
jgi:hypothetical protein